MSKLLLGILLALSAAVFTLGWSTHHFHEKYVEHKAEVADLHGQLASLEADRDRLKESKEALEGTYADVALSTQALQESYELLQNELNAKRCIVVDRGKANEQTEIVGERDFVNSIVSVLNRAYETHIREGGGSDIPSEGSTNALSGSTSRSTNKPQ